jgi:phage terminase large subunit
MSEQRFSRVYWKIYDACSAKPRYISNKGGTRSTKTYSTLQFLFLLIPAVDKAGDITSVVSESFPHLKKGAIRDFENIIGHPLKGDSHWNETDHTWTFDNGAKLEYFSVDNAAKVHGSQRKRLFVNEANHIEYEIFRQLAVRTSSVIFIDYNPASVCWIQQNVECRDNCVLIRSTYKDNPFLSPEQIAEIESNKDDVNWWKVYGQGIEGTLDGLIYNFELIDRLPPKGVDKPEAQKTDEEKYADSLTEIHGLDFGFTNYPTARVQIYADKKRKHLYVRERCCRTHMQNKHIVDDFKADGIGRNVAIYADCAEPKSIADIRDAGYNVIACDKDAPVKSDKLKFQLQWMQGWKLFVTKDSLNLIEELRNYTWAKDKDGNLLNQPIDKWNHLLDAMRYGVWTRFGQNADQGEYHISFSRRNRR